MKIIGILILFIFYSVYIGKMILQKRKGIQTDQMAKSGDKDKVFYVEMVLKIATYSVVVVELISIWKVQAVISIYSIAGAIIGLVGDAIFAAAVITMKDSWRAGLAEGDETEMITGGIYRISRNPAFLGFDCVYLGILLIFFNKILLIFSLFAAFMLHRQIVQEEQYLSTVFGEEYINYKSRVCRYFGRKR